MRIEPNKPWSRTKGIDYFKKLIDGKEPFDLVKPQRKRTIQQNSYFHVACKYIASLSGETTQDIKDKRVKAKWCRDVFYIPLDEEHNYCRSSATLTKEEMSLVIERMIIFAAQDLEIRVPTSEEYIIHQDEINGEINRNKQFI